MARSVVSAVGLSFVIAGCGPAAAPPAASKTKPVDPEPAAVGPTTEESSERISASPAAAVPAAAGTDPEVSPEQAAIPRTPEVIASATEPRVEGTAEEAPPAEERPPAEEPPRGPTLTGTVVHMGPFIDNPDGDGKVLPLNIKLREPDGREMAALAGTLTIRAVEDPARVLWSGRVTLEPEGGGDGIATVFFNVPGDWEDPDVLHLARTHIGIVTEQKYGVIGPPAEVRVERIEYADGTAETF